MTFLFNLVSQPNGGLTENCLTTFIPDNDDSPRWYDRPCVEENDSEGDVGHKFMCECNVPDQNPLGKPFFNLFCNFENIRVCHSCKLLGVHPVLYTVAL